MKFLKGAGFVKFMTFATAMAAGATMVCALGGTASAPPGIWRIVLGALAGVFAVQALMWRDLGK